jgi:hypothetical protein
MHYPGAEQHENPAKRQIRDGDKGDSVAKTVMAIWFATQAAHRVSHCKEAGAHDASTHHVQHLYLLALVEQSAEPQVSSYLEGHEGWEEGGVRAGSAAKAAHLNGLGTCIGHSMDSEGRFLWG